MQEEIRKVFFFKMIFLISIFKFVKKKEASSPIDWISFKIS
jgi:hypothetical protein